MDVNEATGLKALEEENLRLKRLGTDLSLDNQDPQGSKLKKVVSPVQKKVVIETSVGTGRRGVARACRLFWLQGPLEHFPDIILKMDVDLPAPCPSSSLPLGDF